VRDSGSAAVQRCAPGELVVDNDASLVVRRGPWLENDYANLPPASLQYC